MKGVRVLICSTIIAIFFSAISMFAGAQPKEFNFSKKVGLFTVKVRGIFMDTNGDGCYNYLIIIHDGDIIFETEFAIQGGGSGSQPVPFGSNDSHEGYEFKDHTISACPDGHSDNESWNLYNPSNHIVGTMSISCQNQAVYSQIISSMIKIKNDQFNNSLFKNATEITVYPNPANTFATIKIQQVINGGLKYHLYDNDGILIESNEILNLDSQEINIDVSNLYSGIYFIAITEDNRLINSSKIIISK